MKPNGSVAGILASLGMMLVAGLARSLGARRPFLRANGLRPPEPQPAAAP